MKKSMRFLLISAVLAFTGCQHDRSVHAGNDAVVARTGSRRPPAVNDSSGELNGELLRVDPSRKLISIRVANGMEQTFRVDDKTSVTGLQNEKAVGNLPGKEGSEVTVHWQDNGGAKLATNVAVTQIVTWKSRHSGKGQRIS